MPDSRYVIVGGGMAAAAAVRGIREVDPDGSIALVGEEPDPPYKRPPLSKGLWAGKPLDRIWSGTERTEGVTLHPGRTVRLIDPAAKRLVDDHGTVHGYHKLLLATGSAPRRLPFNDGGQVIYFRTLGDYRRLRDLAERGQRFAVIGGGFIGSEIAASLASLAAGGKQVTLIFPGRAIGDRLFPADLAQSLNQAYRGHGVEVLAGHRVTGLERRGDGCVLRLRSGEDGAECERELDGVVAGIGTLPRIELAQASGLEAGDGIIVDRFLRTSHPDIYAAGDVANAWSPALGTRRRVEHEDNAKTMGRQAGRAMAGQPEPWIHLPYFYSDMFEQGYEAVGEVDSRLETVADWDDPFRTGTIRYLADGRVRGVLLWNVWDQVDAARDLIQAGGAIVGDRLPVGAG